MNLEPFVVCLRDADDSQTGEKCGSHGVKERRQRQVCIWHLWTEDEGGTNAAEFKIGDVSFYGQVTIKCNMTESDMETDALLIV